MSSQFIIIQTMSEFRTCQGDLPDGIWKNDIDFEVALLHFNNNVFTARRSIALRSDVPARNRKTSLSRCI